MASVLIESEATFRLLCFFSTLIIMMFSEWYRPRKTLTLPRWYRWTNNFGILILSSMLARLIFPAAAVGTALWAEKYQIGLLYQFESLRAVLTDPEHHPSLFAVVCLLSIVLLDGLIWLQHLVFHRVPWLWRLHRMHHADQDIDASTALRFHPIEILLSLCLKAAVVLAFGLPAVAVLLFEVILNASAIFSHSNVKVPPKFDRLVRAVAVTPDMHRIHHSVLPNETHANFGFFLSVWDRWFGTYVGEPECGHDKMKIGLPVFREVKDQRIDRMLIQPLR